jgi:hypothetical protein
MLPHCEKYRTMITLCPSYPYATILSFTARIERAHSDRARSASKTVERGGATSFHICRF